MNYPNTIDLHLHTVVSDGTDTPEELLAKVKAQGIQMYSITDHDAVLGCRETLAFLQEDDPLFITGVEFSCRDDLGKYHILGYGYDPDAEPIRRVVETGHRYRMEKVKGRIRLLQEREGISFSDDEIRGLLALDNPGKPHIGILMVRHGYAPTIAKAIWLIDELHYRGSYVRPEEAIRGITESGGIPVLAHPVFGSGSEIITGEEMEERLRYLIGFGLKGVEAFYSRYSEEMIREMLDLAGKYELYITAGSDYHGINKKVRLGQTRWDPALGIPDGMRKFFDAVLENRLP